jgi:hypothetical protein
MRNNYTYSCKKILLNVYNVLVLWYIINMYYVCVCVMIENYDVWILCVCIIIDICVEADWKYYCVIVYIYMKAYVCVWCVWYW